MAQEISDKEKAEILAEMLRNRQRAREGTRYSAWVGVGTGMGAAIGRVIFGLDEGIACVGGIAAGIGVNLSQDYSAKSSISDYPSISDYLKNMGVGILTSAVSFAATDYILEHLIQYLQ